MKHCISVIHRLIKKKKIHPHQQNSFFPIASVCELPVCNSVDLEKLIYEDIFKSIVLPQLGDYE